MRIVENGAASIEEIAADIQEINTLTQKQFRAMEEIKIITNKTKNLANEITDSLKEFKTK